MTNGKKTFIKVTNQDIFNELKEFQKQNQIEHQEIINKHITSKGEIKVTKWIAGAGLGISIFISAGLITKVL